MNTLMCYYTCLHNLSGSSFYHGYRLPHWQINDIGKSYKEQFIYLYLIYLLLDETCGKYLPIKGHFYFIIKHSDSDVGYF